MDRIGEHGIDGSGTGGRSPWRGWARTAILFVLALMIAIPALPGKAGAVATGTADGTYDFGGTLGPGGGELRRTGDKFFVTGTAEKRGTSLYKTDQTGAGDLGYIWFKAEGERTLKNYTFKDFGFSGTENGLQLKFLHVSFYAKEGTEILVISNFSNTGEQVRLNVSTAVARLSQWLNSGNEYNLQNVASIKILWQFDNNQPPTKLNFSNIKIANARGGYLLSYNGNGNNAGTAPAGGYYLSGDNVYLPDKGTMAKTNYTFDGWNTKADGTGTTYKANTSLKMNAADLTLYAKWIPTTYKISYNGNGSTGGTAPSDNNGYASGSKATVLGSGSLVRTGYAFGGWNTKADGTGTTFAQGSQYTLTAENVTLYAKWNLIPTYKVTYNGNGATGGAAPTDNNAYAQSASVTIPGAGTLVRAGYSFAGWNSNASGTGTAYALGSTMTMGGANVTLYAKWTLIPTYKVSYNVNGGSGTVPTDGGNYATGATVTVQGAGGISRTGYTFAGWALNAAGTGTAYAAGNTFAMGSANATLYAKWNLNPTYKVTYSGNGSTSGAAPTDNAGYETGKTATVSGAGTLARTGYTFAGWTLNAAGTGTVYGPGAGMTPTLTIGSANVTLYAKWSLNPTYKVTYNGNGSTSGAAPTDNAGYEAGKPATVAGAGTLARTGYTFAGWTLGAAGAGTVYGPGAGMTTTLTMGSANATMYAKWTAIPYKATYSGNGSTSGTVPADTNYTVGASITLATAGTLARTGYTFAGWNTKADGTGTTYAQGLTLTMGAADFPLYGKWTAINYKIVYNGNGNTAGAAPVDNANYTVGAKATLAGAGTLARAGYTFAGWNTQANGNGTNYSSGAEWTMSASNATLYAKWSLIPTYRVDYDGNGETSGTAPVDNGNYVAGAKVTLPGSGSLIRDGFAFVGWNAQADGGGTNYAAGAQLTMGVTDVTLYAKWTELSYTVAFDGNGATGGAPTDGNRYTAGDSVTMPGKGTLTNAGYSFAGWTESSDGTGTLYPAGSSYTMGAADAILYAKWVALPTYTVAYAVFGPETGGVPADPADYLTGEQATVLGRGSLVLPRHSFVGWNTKQDGTGTPYAPGQRLTIGTEDVVLYAKWAPLPTYQVLYQGSGGDGGHAPTDSAAYLTGEEATVAGEGTLTRAGYSFEGWNADPAGNGASYAEGDNIVIGASNVTLYAQWSKLPAYQVLYDGNGASGTVPVDGAEYLTGAGAVVLGKGSLAKSGYEFQGWSTTPGGGGTVYAENDSLPIGTEDVTLYAQWKALYKVYYDGNGSTGGLVPVDAGSYRTGENATVAGAGSLSNAGYAFAGWKDGAGASYSAGDALTIGSSNAVLYAQWTPIATYVISYNGNGATGGSVDDSPAYRAGETATISGSGTLANYGYDFSGWKDGSGTDYAAGSTIAMPAEDLVLYAQWQRLPTYSITYDRNGATSGTAPTDGNSYLPSVTATVYGGAIDLANAGYTFAGWNTQSDGRGTNYAAGSALAMPAYDVTLYANWTLAPTYAIVYNGNGATGGDTPADTNFYLSGSQADILDKNTLVNVGHTFVGWNTQANGGGSHYAIGAKLTVPASDVTLYAEWTQVPTYAVTYHGNGATIGSDPVDLNSYVSGATVTVDDQGSLARPGYAFAGWNSDPEGRGASYASDSELIMGASDVALYAQWTPARIYTIVYHRNGATGGSVPLDVKAYSPGDIAAIAGAGTLEKAGFTFTGWNTAADGKGTRYAEGATLTIVSADLDLYAQWRENSSSSGNTPPPAEAEPKRKAVLEIGNVKLTVDIETTTNAQGKKIDRLSIDSATADKLAKALTDAPGQPVRIRFPEGAATVRLTKDSYAKLKDRAVLELVTPDVALIFSLAEALPRSDAEVRLTALPVAVPSERQAAVDKATSGRKGSGLIGKPVVAEAGDRTGPLIVRFPLPAGVLPADPAKKREFLDSLTVCMIRPDGKVVSSQATAVYGADGKPIAAEARFMLEKTGTFLLLSKESRVLEPYMKGFPNRQFRPEAKLTRVEVAAIVYRLLLQEGDPLAGKAEFRDVPAKHWASEMISAVGGLGLMEAYEDGGFHPNALVSRGEMAAILEKWKKLSVAGTVSGFPDTRGNPNEPSIAAVAEQGYMTGMKDGKFRPDRPLTRAEAVALFNRATGRTGPGGETGQAWTDVPAGHWALDEIRKATQAYPAE